METSLRAVVEALAAAGIEAQLERNGVGQLLLTVKGEAVDDWRDDDGPWVTVVAAESSKVETITPTELAVQLWGRLRTTRVARERAESVRSRVSYLPVTRPPRARVASDSPASCRDQAQPEGGVNHAPISWGSRPSAVLSFPHEKRHPEFR